MPDTRFKKVYTFNSARKSMSTIIPLDSGGFRVYTKGASEIVMKKCSFLVGEGGKIEMFTAAHQDRLVQTVIEPMAKDGLRTISIALLGQENELFPGAILRVSDPWICLK